jgi:uncharacterized protein (TIGR02001 family)
MGYVMTVSSALRTFLIGVSLSATLINPAIAQETAASAWTLSGNGAFKSDYAFRGFSQTDEEPSVQGSIDLNHESGFEASLRGSNVDFNDGDEASSEIDATASYTMPLGSGDFTLGGIYYAYLGAYSSLNYNYVEAYSGYAFNIGSVADINGQVFYSPDFFAGSGDAVYTLASVSVPVQQMEGLSLNGSLGHQWIDDNAQFGAEDYSDWSLSASYTWEKISFGLTYHDSDISEGDCSSLCDQRIVGSLSYSF